MKKTALCRQKKETSPRKTKDLSLSEEIKVLVRVGMVSVSEEKQIGVTTTERIKTVRHGGKTL